MSQRGWIGIALVGVVLSGGAALSRDGYGNDGRPLVCDPAVMGNGPRVERCRDWIEHTMQPDNRAISCCGDGDAFITDDYEIGKDGQFYAIVTEDYPERPGYEGSGVKKGTRIAIPRNKINNAALDGGNPSGHSVTFLLPGTLTVLCYFGPTGV